MSNRRKKSWPSGFYSDGLSYRMKTADGRFARLGSNEVRALRRFHQARRLEDEGDSIGAAASPRMTLRVVAERWFEAQQADGVRDVDRDFGRFKNRVDPLIGSRRIGREGNSSSIRVPDSVQTGRDSRVTTPSVVAV